MLHHACVQRAKAQCSQMALSRLDQTCSSLPLARISGFSLVWISEIISCGHWSYFSSRWPLASEEREPYSTGNTSWHGSSYKLQVTTNKAQGMDDGNHLSPQDDDPDFGRTVDRVREAQSVRPSVNASVLRAHIRGSRRSVELFEHFMSTERARSKRNGLESERY